MKAGCSWGPMLVGKPVEDLWCSCCGCLKGLPCCVKEACGKPANCC